MKIWKRVFCVVLFNLIVSMTFGQTTVGGNPFTAAFTQVAISSDGKVQTGITQEGEVWVSKDTGSTWERKNQDEGKTFSFNWKNLLIGAALAALLPIALLISQRINPMYGEDRYC